MLESDDVETSPVPSVTFGGAAQLPYSQTVLIRASDRIVHTCGVVPPLADPSAPMGSSSRYGDTYRQAVGVIKTIRSLLQAHQLGLQDVVQLRTHLVQDPISRNVDFEGWFRAYNDFFNCAANPGKPVRATLTVPGLVDLGWLVEIEATAVARGRGP